MVEFICNLVEDEDLENLKDSLMEYNIDYEFNDANQSLRVSDEDERYVEEILNELFIDYELVKDCED